MSTDLFPNTRTGEIMRLRKKRKGDDVLDLAQGKAPPPTAPPPTVQPGALLSGSNTTSSAPPQKRMNILPPTAIQSTGEKCANFIANMKSASGLLKLSPVQCCSERARKRMW